MKKIPQIILVALFAAGCATPTQTFTLHVAEPHSAVPVQSVVFMPAPPTNGVLIANLLASSDNSPGGAEAAQADLKKSAAAIGATVLVLDPWNITLYGWDYGNLKIGGHAYFVPPSDVPLSEK